MTLFIKHILTYHRRSLSEVSQEVRMTSYIFGIFNVYGICVNTFVTWLR